MPADLIDEIGPAPDNSKKPRNSANMVMDNIDDSVYANFLDQEIIADTYSIGWPRMWQITKVS